MTLAQYLEFHGFVLTDRTLQMWLSYDKQRKLNSGIPTP